MQREKIFIFGKILEDNIISTNLQFKTDGFCLPLREKTLVSNCLTSLGGGGANVAMGFKKLGFLPLVLGMVGKDESGEKARSILKNAGIRTDFIGASKLLTGKSIIILAKSKSHVALVYPGANQSIKAADIEINKIKSCRWWYVLSWGNNDAHIAKKIAEYKQKLGVHLAFNPGKIQLDNPNHISSLIKATDILFVNEKELETLLNKKIETSDYKKALVEVVGLGPKIVVLTLGSEGSMVYNGAHFYEAPIMTVKVADGLGAGDAYSSAFLAWFIKSGRIDEAIKAGTINSAYVVSKNGAQSGQLSKKELADLVKKEKIYVRISSV